MELHLEQQQISSFVLQAKRHAEERFSSDCVVPDTLPDAANLLLTEGELCLWRLDLAEGSAELEGEIAARVTFRTEAGEPFGFPVSIPVSVRFRGEELQSGLRPYLSCRVAELTGQLLNSRKVRLQGRLACELTLYTPKDLALTTGIDAEEKSVFLRRDRMTVSVVSAVEEQVFSVSETIPLRLGFPAEGRILSHSSVPVLEETQILNRRLILQGRVVTTLLYLDAQRAELVSETIETPFSQLADTASDEPISAADTAVHLTSVELRCRNDDQAVETEFHLVAQTVCFSSVESDCVIDAYSANGSLSLSWASEPLPAIPAQPLQETVDGVLSCNPSGKSICAARSALRGDRVEITLLLQGGEEGLSVLTGQLALPEGAQCPVLSEAPAAAPCPEGFAVHVPVAFREAAALPEPLRQISGASLEQSEDADDRPSVKLVLRTDTDLWTVAKTHASSEEAIRAANPETDPPSRWLLIPRVI